MSILKDLFDSIEGDDKVLICVGENRDYYITFFPLLYGISCKHINDTKIVGNATKQSTPILFLDEFGRDDIIDFVDPLFGELKNVPIIERMGEEIRIREEKEKVVETDSVPLEEFDRLFEMILSA